MKKGNLLYDNAKISYVKWGVGTNVLLCFHGYGLDKHSFDVFDPLLNHLFTVYSFDLFAHGESKWGKHEQALPPQVWAQMLIEFCDAEKIDNFSVLAYSMGGKIALATLEVLPQKIQQLIMVAPDGIDNNPWYRAATYPGVFNHFFKRIIYKPTPFLKMVKLLGRLQLLDKAMVKFVCNEMNSPAKRERVYYAWMIYRKFLFNKKRIAHIINSHKMPTLWVVAEYDKVIPLEKIKDFALQLTHSKMLLVNTGHTELLKKLSQEPSFLPLIT